MFNLIARRNDNIRVRATLSSHRPSTNVGSPLDKLDSPFESFSGLRWTGTLQVGEHRENTAVIVGGGQ